MYILKKKIILTFFLLILLVFFSSVALKVRAADCDDKSGQDKVNCLQAKVNDLNGQAKTLSSQIAIMDSQINLTQAKIEANKKEILDLTLDIDTATKKITTLQDRLQKITNAWIKRVVASYEAGGVQPMEILLSSSDVSSLLVKLNYLQIVKKNDEKSIIDVQQTKTDYSNQKDIFEEKKKQVEALKVQLEAYTNQLNQEKQGKQALLTQTKGSEAKYQDLLDQAHAELAIAFGGGTETFMRDVSEGESIGTIIVGQSGCSTGTHLHFEVHKNESIDDPNNYLSSTSFAYLYGESDTGSINPHGSWTWPINGPILITQGYGMTPYAQSGAYGGKPHYGIDMFSDSLAVKATKNGQLYRGSYQCWNGTLYYAKVKQADGIDSLYLHIFPH